MGIFSLYNCKSGEQLFQLVKAKEIHRRENKDQSHGQKKSYEIVQIIYCEVQQIVFTLSCDSVARMYEVQREEFSFLKEFVGGHASAEMTAGAYSAETLTLYTGAANGTIAIWRVNFSKIENIFTASDSEITSIVDLFPYPCLLASNSKGMIQCWRVKESTSQSPLLFLISVGQLLTDPGLASSNVLGIKSLMRIVPNEPFELIHDRYHIASRLAKEQAKRAKHMEQPHPWVEYEDIREELASEVYGGIPLWQLEGLAPPNVMTKSDSEPDPNDTEKKDEKGIKTIQKDVKSNINDTIKSINRRIKGDDYVEIESPKHIIPIQLFPTLEEEPTPRSKLPGLGSENSSRPLPADKEPSKTEFSNTLSSKSLYVTSASTGGQIYIFPIEFLLKRHGIEPLSRKEYHPKRHLIFRSSMQRNEVIQADNKVYTACIKSTQRQLSKFPLCPIYLDSLIAVRCWLAHRDRLVCAHSVDHILQGITTASRDNVIRVWSLNGYLWAEINFRTLKNVVWNLPFDFLHPIINHLDDALDTLKVLDSETVINSEKREKLICKYLFDNYVHPVLNEQYQVTLKTQNKQFRKEEWQKQKKTLKLSSMETLESIPALPAPPLQTTISIATNLPTPEYNQTKEIATPQYQQKAADTPKPTSMLGMKLKRRIEQTELPEDISTPYRRASIHSEKSINHSSKKSVKNRSVDHSTTPANAPSQPKSPFNFIVRNSKIAPILQRKRASISPSIPKIPKEKRDQLQEQFKREFTETRLSLTGVAPHCLNIMARYGPQSNQNTASKPLFMTRKKKIIKE